MLQDPNVERAIKEAIKPLKSEITKLKKENIMFKKEIAELKISIFNANYSGYKE